MSSDAAVTDLAMYHLLLKYSAIDSDISHEVLTAQSRHQWYLSPDSIILWSLFGTMLSEDEKSQSVLWPQRLSSQSLHLPQIEHLITPMSWFPFVLLGLQDSWLGLPPAQWGEYKNILEMKEFTHSVKVTNDVADRGVKLVADYADILTTDSEERKRLVLAVQNQRMMYKNMNKASLVKRIGENRNQSNNEDDNEESIGPLNDEWSEDDDELDSYD